MFRGSAVIKRLTLLGLFLFTAFFCLVLDSEAATIRISSPKVQLKAAPGETYAGEITAENPTEEEVKVRIYLEDWVYAAGGTGQKNFSPMGTTPLSAAKWITFSPAEDAIKPFGRTIVHYTIQVPQDAKGTHYAVLFFETIIGSAKDEEGVNVMVAGRIGSLFYVEVKGLAERKGEIKSVELKPSTGNKPLEIVTTFHNMGNTDITLGGNFLIMDKPGKVVGRGDVDKVYTFPGTTESSTTQWVGRLPKGVYSVLLTYDLGEGKSLVEERPLRIE
ncbi:MAG: hypothetical protein AUJ71_03920 [Candidatus Omnitrophica bacterium CG1_02_49_16]|nr:MAG: hypothetical protein AUJ71_03920 [Candidatus Omnitrophica bacterium CG1_02_49_16]